MRTTVTLEDDVFARLERLRKTRPFKELINEALRAGLDELESPARRPRTRYELSTVRGAPRRTDLDNVAQVIADVDGDSFR